jgi:phytoene synthase
MNPDDYCREKTAQSGSSFYYSFLFLSEQQRQAITARNKLDWWRQEISQTFNQQASHPISKALITAIDNYDLHEEYFLEIIDGMAMDLDQFSYPSFKQLALYCHRVASAVGLLAVEVFGYQNRATLKYAENLGMALQLTNIIRDVREDAERGRIYIPQEDIEQFNVDVDDVLALKSSPELIQLLKFQTQRARDYYQKAISLLPNCDRHSQRTGLIMSEIYQTTLDEIELDGFRVMDHRVTLTPIRKLWIAWKIANKNKRSQVQPA